jgi:hypothetical protein
MHTHTSTCTYLTCEILLNAQSSSAVCLVDWQPNSWMVDWMLPPFFVLCVVFNTMNASIHAKLNSNLRCHACKFHGFFWSATGQAMQGVRVVATSQGLIEASCDSSQPINNDVGDETACFEDVCLPQLSRPACIHSFVWRTK